MSKVKAGQTWTRENGMFSGRTITIVGDATTSAEVTRWWKVRYSTGNTTDLLEDYIISEFTLDGVDIASEVETLEARLQLVKDLALTARNAAPYGQEPYWVSPILQAIGESK